MKKKNVLPLTDVLAATRIISGVVDDEENEIICVPVDLVDGNDDIGRYISLSVCKSSEEADAKISLRKCNGMSVDDFIDNNPYHHVTTFPIEYAGSEIISFDPDDDVPVKAGFHSKDVSLDIFFKNFNSFRNGAIDRKQPLKDDDIFQYLYIYTGQMKRALGKEEPKENIFQKIKRELFGK